jgi:hypothetical protein
MAERIGDSLEVFERSRLEPCGIWAQCLLSAEGIIRSLQHYAPSGAGRFAMQVEVDRGEAGAQPVVILVDSPISCRNRRWASVSERMLHRGPDA